MHITAFRSDKDRRTLALFGALHYKGIQALSSRYGDEGMSQLRCDRLKLCKWDATAFCLTGIQPPLQNGEDGILFILLQPNSFLNSLKGKTQDVLL